MTTPIPPVWYTVTGRWPFPVDMLRKDGSVADTPADAKLIEALSADDRPNPNPEVTISLVHINPPTRFWEPVIERWNSFGWKVSTRDKPSPTPVRKMFTRGQMVKVTRGPGVLSDGQGVTHDFGESGAIGEVCSIVGPSEDEEFTLWVEFAVPYQHGASLCTSFSEEHIACGDIVPVTDADEHPMWPRAIGPKSGDYWGWVKNKMDEYIWGDDEEESAPPMQPPSPSREVIPTWVGILPLLIDLADSPNDESRAIARRELRRMAEAADLWNASQKPTGS